jgi:hypothetical protein
VPTPVAPFHKRHQQHIAQIGAASPLQMSVAKQAAENAALIFWLMMIRCFSASGVASRLKRDLVYI